MDASISQGIIDLLQSNEVKIEMDEVRCLVMFLKAVERGKKLHPGPISFLEWKMALQSEIFEMKNENCQACETCTPRKCAAPLTNMKSFRGEVMDIEVVVHRFGQFLDEMIVSEEGRITKEAMEHDPR